MKSLTRLVYNIHLHHRRLLRDGRENFERYAYLQENASARCCFSELGTACTPCKDVQERVRLIRIRLIVKYMIDIKPPGLAWSCCLRLKTGGEASC
jgi:hypothetical protein